MATETLQELLIKIRTVGEKEAKAAIKEALDNAKKEQADLRKVQASADKARAAEQKKRQASQAKSEKEFLATLTATEKKHEADKLATQKEADKRRLDAEKKADRERIQLAKETARKLREARQAEVDRRTKAVDAGRSLVSSGVSKVGDKIVGGAVSLGKAAVAGGVGLAIGGAASFKDFIDDASELKSVASFTSMTTKRLQELNFAVEQNGVSSGLLADGMRQFNAGMRESAKGGGTSGAVVEGVEDLGISFKKLMEMKPEDQLFAILEAGNKVGPSMHRAGVFAKVFGETAGAGFARLADQGVDSLKATAAQASKLGFVLSGEAIDGAVKAKQSLSALMSTVGGLKNSLLAELLPTVNEWLTTAQKWVTSNRELIKGEVTKWVKELHHAAQAAAPYVRDLFKLFKEALPVLIEWGPVLLQIGVGLKAFSVAEQAAKHVQTLATAFNAAQAGAQGLAGASGIGAIVLALNVLLPLAIKVGSALGDIGNQDTGARATLAKKILGANVDMFGVAGGSGYSSQLSKLSEEEIAKVEAELFSAERARDVRLRGKFENVFADARRRKQEREDAATGEEAFKSQLGADLADPRKYSSKDLESLRDQGIISQEDFDLARGSRGTGRLTRARKGEGEKEKQVTDEELLKLINSASKSGANLDELLKGRKIAGGTPPVITVTQHITNVNSTATINVKARDGQSSTSVAQEIVSQFTELLSGQIRKALPAGAIAR